MGANRALNQSIRRVLAFAVSLPFAAVTAAVPVHAQQNEVLRFALTGDLGYSKQEESEIPCLMEEIDAGDLAFVIHDGDCKGGSPREARPGRSTGAPMSCSPAGSIASNPRPTRSSTRRGTTSGRTATSHPRVNTTRLNDWTNCAPSSFLGRRAWGSVAFRL